MPMDFTRVKETSFDRGGVIGLKPFVDGTAPEEYEGLYAPEELEEIRGLQGTNRDPEARMKVRVSDWYAKLAKTSMALNNLVTVDPNETVDLSGEADPSNQKHYMPVEGLLHKYPEIVLLYVAKTCSSHCRYCYRLDLFSGKTGKGLAKIDEIVDYIKEHNDNVKMDGGIDPKCGTPIFPITEALLSGGDPMVLNNAKLAKYMSGLAEAGVSTIRIGTKELAFHPQRFDNNFFDMLDKFHAAYPDVKFNFMVHFSHPDEFLARDKDGKYTKVTNNSMKWMPEVEGPVKQLVTRDYVSLYNQTPIIARVNDDPAVLRLLQREMAQHKINNHYLFQCREIEGHVAFAVPVEKTLQIFNESQKGLSGNEQHAKLVMSTSLGKMEIVGVTKGREAQAAFSVKPEDAPDGVIVFKVLRSPQEVGSSTQGDLVIAKRMPEALWISDYVNAGAIIYDGTGQLRPEPAKPAKKEPELIQLDLSKAYKWAQDKARFEGKPLN